MSISTDVFGEITTGTEIKNAVIETLQTWLPTYLQEVEHQLDRPRGDIVAPKVYKKTNTFDTIDVVNIPVCLVVCPGLAGRPAHEGDGYYRAPFTLGIACIVSARDEESTKEVADIYGAAVRACMLQKRLSVTGLDSDVDWIEESYDDIPEQDSRTLGAAQVIFTVTVYDVVSRIGGPLAPADPVKQPGSEWPFVGDVVIDSVDQIGLSDPMLSDVFKIARCPWESERG